MTKAQRNPKVQFPIGGGRGDDSQNLRLKDYQTGRGNALVGGGGEFWWDVWLSVGLLRDVARPGKVAEEFVRSWASRGGLWCWTLGLVTRNNSAKARKGNALKFKLFKFAGAVLLLIVLAVTLAVWNYRFCSRYVRLPGLNLLFMGCFSRSAFTHLNKGEWDAAIADFTNAIRVDGESGLVDAEWAGRGMAYDGKHEWDKAIGDLTEAIKRNAQTTAAYEYRAEAYGEKREWDKSISDCNEIIRLDPSHAGGHGMRGRAHYYKGEYEQALDDFKEQTRLDPKNWVAFHWLACMLATCPTASIRDGDAAVKAATSACELKGGKDPDCIGALAGAYAEAGDFGQAVKYQKELLGLEGITEKDRVVYQQRLKLYQSRKPYHMAPR